MKVAMIGLRAPREGLGGVEGVVRSLAPQLARRGVELTVFCRERYLQGEPCEGAREIGLPSLPGAGVETLSYALQAVVRCGPFDVVHLHAHGSALLSGVARALGPRVVVTLHGLDWARPKWGRLARALLKAGEGEALRRADVVTVVSRDLAEHYRALGHTQIRYIPNGVDLPGPAGAALLPAHGLEPGRYGLFLGRLVPDKEVHTLLAAWRRSRAGWPLVVAGPIGDQHTYGAQLADLARGEPRIRRVGAVQGQLKAELLAHAGLFVLPSRVEGASLALLEAMAAGRPCLVSDIPANLELTALAAASFPVGDEGALSAAIDDLIHSADRRAALGAAARHRVERHFSWAQVADELVSVYRELLSGKAREGAPSP